MADVGLLRDILVLFFLASAVLWLFHRLKLPGIVGFLVTGIVAGPNGLRWVHDADAVRQLADIGVVLLLFTIGAEFSLRRLLALRRHVLGGGMLQVVLTILVVGLLAKYSLGTSLTESYVLGCIVSLSSTAVVLRLLAARGETAGPAGRAIVGMLIFQDLAVVPMMISVGLLSGQNNQSWPVLAIAGLALAALIVAARVLIPRLLEGAAKTRSHELFVFVVGLIILGAAWVSAQAGLSLALGAFLAGLVVADNEYSHQVLTEVLPFRESFIGLFFTSVGMLLDPQVFTQHLATVLTWGSVVIVGKIAVVLLVSILLRYSWPVAVRGAFSLGQIGEFSFVLAGNALAANLLAPAHYPIVVAVTVLSMMLSPMLLWLGAYIADRLCDWRPAVKIFGGSERHTLGRQSEPLSDHVIIVGYGMNGRHIAASLQRVGVPALALEIDPSRMHAKLDSTPVLFGDASSAEVLDAAGLERARAIVVAVSDLASTRRILKAAKTLAPEVPLIARTRHLADVAELYALGAREVVVEEVEASMEILLILLGLTGLDESGIRNALLQKGHHRSRHGTPRHENLSRAEQETNTPRAPEQ